MTERDGPKLLWFSIVLCLLLPLVLQRLDFYALTLMAVAFAIFLRSVLLRPTGVRSSARASLVAGGVLLVIWLALAAGALAYYAG